jgi:hypothetical protein
MSRLQCMACYLPLLELVARCIAFGDTIVLAKASRNAASSRVDLTIH